MPHASEQWEASQDLEQPEQGRGMHRRSFLKAAAGIGAGMMLGKKVHASNQSASIDVNAFAENFPKAHEFEGIDRITTNLRSNARHLLIHLRIIHWHNDETTESDIREVKVCQEQWHRGLQSMIKHPYTKLRSVYAEGMNATGVDRRFSEPLDVDDIVARHKPRVPLNDIPVAAKSDRQPPKVDPESYPLMIRKGADHVLQAAGELELKGIEWPDIHELSIISSRNGWSNWREYQYSLRERAAQEIIAAGRDRIAYVFYGASHKWHMPITMWNRQYPDDRFSLIEITPDCMIDDATGDDVAFEDPDKKQPPPPPLAERILPTPETIAVAG